MTIFALIHGAGDSGRYWRLVEPALRERGCGGPRISRQTKSANLQTYADTVIEAIGDRTDVVVDSGHCVALSHPKELAERLAST